MFFRSLTRRLLAISLLAPAAMAQTPAPTQPSLGELRPQVVPAKALLSPGEPIWVQFILANESEQVVELDAPGPEDGIVLPRSVVLGTADGPSLAVSFNNAAPASVVVPSSSAAPPRVLRIAGRGMVGAVLDLRDVWREARYVGEYRIQWRPFDGRYGTATATLRIEPRKLAVLVTDHGKITFRLAYDRAPRNVENFLELARGGFYNGKTIHRIIPGFAIQGGSPTGDATGTRPDGKLVPAELTDEPFDVGTLAMARKPDDLNTASCQFFVTLARAAELDGRYTIIGHVADDESIRSLRQLATISTDQKNRPVHALVIRSISLVDEETPAAARRSAAQP